MLTFPLIAEAIHIDELPMVLRILSDRFRKNTSSLIGVGKIVPITKERIIDPSEGDITKNEYSPPCISHKDFIRLLNSTHHSSGAKIIINSCEEDKVICYVFIEGSSNRERTLVIYYINDEGFLCCMELYYPELKRITVCCKVGSPEYDEKITQLRKKNNLFRYIFVQG